MEIVPGTLDWINEEPEYVGPSDEIEFFFMSLIQAARSGSGMGYDAELEAIAKLAWGIQSEGIIWIYHEDYHDPEEYGMPTRDQFFARATDDTTNIELATWAYNNVNEDRRQLYWAERDEKYRQERLAELREKVKDEEV